LHGVGVYTWPDGKSYSGQYDTDRKHGYGTYILKDGRKYEGWWMNGKQQGLGTFHFKDSKNLLDLLTLYTRKNTITCNEERSLGRRKQTDVDY